MNSNDGKLAHSNQQKLTQYFSDLVKKGLNLANSLELTNNNFQILNNIVLEGIKNYELGNYKEAINWFNQVIEIDSSNINCLCLLGLAKSMINGETSGIKDLKKAFELSPDYDSIIALYAYGIIYTVEQKPLQMKQYLAKALEQNPSGSPFISLEFFFKGSIYCILGEKLKALEEFSKSVKANPDCLISLNIQSLIKSEIKAKKDVIDQLTEFLELLAINNEFNKADHILCLRGSAYYDLGNMSQALDDLNQALKINPSYIEALSSRAIVHTSLGNYKCALEDYTKLINFNPNNRDAYTKRSAIRLLLQDFIGALEDTQKAQQLS